MRLKYPVLILVTTLYVLTLASGCSDRADQAHRNHDSHKPGTLGSSHVCAICGMYVSNQAAPRAQILHRNGERAFFCSIGDMLTYNQIPSPHGKAEKIWVEAVAKEMNPAMNSTDISPWVDHMDAHYVTGINRKMVMGYPVLALQSRADSEHLQQSHGGQLAGWEQLLEQHKHSLQSRVQDN